jgi:chromosome segregation ATPase
MVPPTERHHYLDGDDLRDPMEELRLEMQALADDNAKLAHEVDVLRADLDAVEATLDGQEDQIDDLVRWRDHLADELKSVQEDLEHHDDIIAAVRAFLSELDYIILHFNFRQRCRLEALLQQLEAEDIEPQ